MKNGCLVQYSFSSGLLIMPMAKIKAINSLTSFSHTLCHNVILAFEPTPEFRASCRHLFAYLSLQRYIAQNYRKRKVQSIAEEKHLKDVVHKYLQHQKIKVSHTYPHLLGYHPILSTVNGVRVYVRKYFGASCLNTQSQEVPLR